MKLITRGIVDYYVADDIIENPVERFGVENHSQMRIMKMLKRPGWHSGRDEDDFSLDERNPYESYLKMYAQMQGLPERLAVIDAHGDSRKVGKKEYWIFFDGERERNMQNWLRSVDGKYAALLLYSCNPGHCWVSSQESVVISPDRIVVEGGHSDSEDRNALFDFVVPGVGVIDDYTIDYELEELRKKMRGEGR